MQQTFSMKAKSVLFLGLFLAEPAFSQESNPAPSDAPSIPTEGTEIRSDDATGPQGVVESEEGVAVESPTAVQAAESPEQAESSGQEAPQAPSDADREAAAAEAEAAALEAQAEAAALEAAMLETAADQSAVGKYALDLYGFADFTYSQGLQGQQSDNGQFFVGRLNVYLSAELGDRWRSLAEVRFSYLPHGAFVDGETSRTFVTAADYVDLGRPVRVGGVILERAWLEYSAHPLANVRVGQFLTPYGIWNVDHGSPVIIGSRRPFIIGERLFPEWQTGFQLHGSHHFGRAEVGYNATLSNGRGPIDMYFDMDANKGVGGRIYLNLDTDFGALAVGTSAYGGTYTDIEGDNFGSAGTIVEQYDEFSIAGDLKYTLDGFLVQGEVIRNDIRYSADGRPPATGGNGYLPDHRKWGLYGLAGYRFDFLGIMPFIAIDYSDPGPSGFATKATAFWTGLNVRPTPRVVLKMQYTYSWFPPDSPFPDFHYSAIDTQAAWSF